MLQQRETINLVDPYNDPRFDQTQDKKSNYVTTNMLTMPVFGAPNAGERAVVAVVQLLNKASGPFNTEDIEFMTTFMNIVGPILEQSSLYQKTLSSAPRNKPQSETNEVANSGSVRSKPSTMTQGISDVIEEGDDEDN